MSAYDTITATHYARYRPPLHLAILERALGNNFSRARGLDFGCGTGHSSVALAKFCTSVTAVDSSEEMLRAAITHPGVTYLPAKRDLAVFPDDHFDVVSLAGSWFHARSPALVRELTRLLSPSGSLLLYDFDVQLGVLLARLGVMFPAEGEVYDHDPTFDGTLRLTQHERWEGELNITLPNLADFILSVADWRRELARLLPCDTPDLRECLVHRLLAENHNFRVKHYFRRYSH